MHTPSNPASPVNSGQPFQVAALYCFTRLENPSVHRDALDQLCRDHGICGTLLLAGEGINGTIAGSDEGIAAVVAYIRAMPGCADADVKYSRAATAPFLRMTVRLKREIVTMSVSLCSES